MPSRQSFVYEMVGPDDLANAVGLNAVIINSSRIIGPAIGGVLIAGVGVAPCFLFNAASFVAVIAALLLMRPAELSPQQARARASPGQVREGLRYVWRTPELRVPLVMLAVVSTLAYNYSVDPAAAHQGRVRPRRRRLRRPLRGHGRRRARRRSAHGQQGAPLAPPAAWPAPSPSASSPCVLAVAPGYYAGAGAARRHRRRRPCSSSARTNSLLQLNADDAMRGRVMSLWAVVFLGSTPIGGPLTGLLVRGFGVRWAVAIGGVATLATAVGAVLRPCGAARLQGGSCEGPACLPDEPVARRRCWPRRSRSAPRRTPPRGAAAWPASARAAAAARPPARES